MRCKICYRLVLIHLLLCVAVLLSSCNIKDSNSTDTITTQTTTATTAATTKVQVTYILNINKRSHRFHRPDCHSAENIKEENRLDFTGTREEAIARGYKPCGNCNP
jgi:DNA-entry nuclease